MDNLNGTYHDLKSGLDYNFTSVAGTFNDRFDVVFQTNQTLSTEDVELDQITLYYNTTQQSLYVKELKEEVKTLVIYNTLGQVMYKNSSVTTHQLANGLAINGISTGVYIVSIQLNNNTSIDKKIIVK